MKTLDNERTKLDSFAWPGGYPIFYLARDGWRDGDTNILDFNPHDRTVFVCCYKCAQNVTEWPDFIIVGQQINYEDEDLYCEACDEKIESAYGED